MHYFGLECLCVVSLYFLRVNHQCTFWSEHLYCIWVRFFVFVSLVYNSANEVFVCCEVIACSPVVLYRCDVVADAEGRTRTEIFGEVLLRRIFEH